MAIPASVHWLRALHAGTLAQRHQTNPRNGHRPGQRRTPARAAFCFFMSAPRLHSPCRGDSGAARSRLSLARNTRAAAGAQGVSPRRDTVSHGRRSPLRPRERVVDRSGSGGEERLEAIGQHRAHAGESSGRRRPQRRCARQHRATRADQDHWSAAASAMAQARRRAFRPGSPQNRPKSETPSKATSPNAAERARPSGGAGALSTGAHNLPVSPLNPLGIRVKRSLPTRSRSRSRSHDAGRASEREPEAEEHALNAHAPLGHLAASAPPFLPHHAATATVMEFGDEIW
jgi:hypothetical protein